jgi:hypothetical protein
LRASAPAFLISSRYNLIIGEISGGCHLVSLGSSCHVNGKWTTAPGSSAVSKTANAAWSTSRWPATSFTSPTILPKGYSMAATRGIPISRLNSGTMVRTTVDKPFSSSDLATSPTDRGHKGQVGVSRTASTPSACMSAATLGMLSFKRTVGSI